MSAPSYKPVVACSLLATSVLYIGYLWFKHRQEETNLSSGASSPLSGTVPDFDQVQERLANIKRHRLDTLEEEPVTQDTAVEATSEATETKPEVVPDLSEDNSKSVKVHFACTDIRYRHLEQQEEDLTVTIVEDKSEVATEMAVDDTVTSSVPDVMAALNDPLCGDNNNDDTSPASPHSYSSSPVKSESAQSKSSCDWSDLIEQDEKEMQEFQLDSRELTCKLSGLELESAGGRSNDSGVASPSDQSSEGAGLTKSRTQSGGEGDQGIGGSEQGDETTDGGLEDHQLLAYHFHIPEYLCGKLIGAEGIFINELKSQCHVNIFLKELEDKKRKKHRKDRRRNYYDEPTIKLCCIEGTRTNIDRVLNKLKKKFNTNTEITFEQVNRTGGSGGVTVTNGNACLSLAEGVMHDVFVSSIVSGGHIFLQQPCHPTYFALERLDQCMTNTYTQFNCPSIPQPVILNSVCAAPCEGGWYRAQIVSYDQDSQTCDIKYLDYGGYASVSVDCLKQIRTDFLTLPFQAIECYLANIQPTDDESVSALVLEELVSGQVVQARMIGTNEQGIPMIHLYRAVSGQTTMVNRELVDRSCASWLDTTIVQLESPLDHPSIMWSNLGNFQNRNLGPNAWDMLSHIYYVPTSDNTEHYDSTMEYYDDNTTMEYYEDNANLKYQEDLTNVSDLNVSFDQPCELQQCPCEIGLNHLSSTPI